MFVGGDSHHDFYGAGGVFLGVAVAKLCAFGAGGGWHLAQGVDGIGYGAIVGVDVEGG